MTRRVVGLSLLAAGAITALVAVTVVHAPVAPVPTPARSVTAESTPAPVTTTTTSGSPLNRTKLATDVSASVAEVVAGAELGLVAYDNLTGAMLAARNADEPFYAASVVKLLIAAHVLRDAGWRVPAGDEREDLATMLTDSADWVASALWDAHRGTAIVRKMTALMGLSNTSPPRDPGQWELTRMSARDVLAVYTYVLSEMPEPAAGFVLSALAASPRTALDGFDQHFGIPAAFGGTEFAVKQGWMLVDAGLVLNTTGLVGRGERYTVVLLTLLPGDTGYTEGRAAVTAGATTLAPALSSDTG